MGNVCEGSVKAERDIQTLGSDSRKRGRVPKWPARGPDPCAEYNRNPELKMSVEQDRDRIPLFGSQTLTEQIEFRMCVYFHKTIKFIIVNINYLVFVLISAAQSFCKSLITDH